MIYCNECGAITEGKERAEMIDGRSRPYMVCAYCGSDDVENAVKCILCGEWKQRDHSDICESCFEDIWNYYLGALDALEEKHGENKRNEIIESMAYVFEEFYNKYF